MGGGLYLTNVLGAVNISSSLITANVAASRGGGVGLDGTLWLNASQVTFTDNSALGGVVGWELG